MRIKPRKDLYQIKLIDLEQEQAGSIILAEHNTESSSVGEIIETPEDSNYSIGDRVIFQSFNVEQLVLTGTETLHFIDEKHILATVQNDMKEG